MWNKLENSGRGAPQITKPRLSISKTSASIRVPESVHGGAERASVYSDGNGKIAFSFGADGEFTAFKVNKTGSVRGVAIAKRLAGGIPNGTHELPERFEDGMLVVDLAALRAPA